MEQLAWFFQKCQSQETERKMENYFGFIKTKDNNILHVTLDWILEFFKKGINGIIQTTEYLSNKAYILDNILRMLNVLTHSSAICFSRLWQKMSSF